jgi:hypothetical protein
MGWVLHIVWLEIVEWIDAVFAALPGRIGTHVRGLIVRGRVRSAGGGIRIGPGVEITGHRGIDLGR